MTPTHRHFRDEDDTWRIRAFLREIFLINGRRERSWQAYRFDYWRWHGIPNMGDGTLEEHVFLWETADGRLAAVLNREAKGHAHLQIHPAHDTPALQEAMIALAEERLPSPGPNGRTRLVVWSPPEDAPRREILTRRGFTRAAVAEHQRRCDLDAPIPEAPPAAGYRVRALGDADEHAERSLLSWKVFHPGEPDERYEGHGWYVNIQRAPLYRRDLDLVAVAPGGELAAFATIWFDNVTRTGAFEPVGTAPAHQRRGLGKAVLCEGLRRLRRLGATRAFVGSYSPPAHALYAAAGFRDYDLSEPWVKAF